MKSKDDQFESPFVTKMDRLLENDTGFVIYDEYPVTDGHCLIIPHRVFSDYFDASPKEVEGLNDLVFKTKKMIDEEFGPTGYNIGINCGVHAGQTVSHVHIHLIPRYLGDMDDPRGGVRGVIPSKQKY